MFYAARKYFKGECAGKPDAASASGKKVDGLIILGDMTKPYIEQIEKEGGVPVVCLDFYNDAVGLDTVISNSFYGTYALTNYLFSMGHKIAYVGTVGMTNSITDRYLGYLKSMMEHGMDVPKIM